MIFQGVRSAYPLPSSGSALNTIYNPFPGVAPINNNALSGPAGCGSVRIRDGYQVTLAMKVCDANIEDITCVLMHY